MRIRSTHLHPTHSAGGCLQVADKRIRARAHTEAASMQARPTPRQSLVSQGLWSLDWLMIIVLLAQESNLYQLARLCGAPSDAAWAIHPISHPAAPTQWGRRPIGGSS